MAETYTEEQIDAMVDQLLAEVPPSSVRAQEFLGHQFDRGLGWIHFPVGSGGLNQSPGLQSRINRRLAQAGAPSMDLRNVIGHGMIAPTISVHGTDSQKAKYLRPLFTSEFIFCQLFSEPGAGSDVASLSAKAERDGDEWILNGQKVWTTLAHLSHFGMIVARTDPDQVKHKGITAFIVDLRSEGAEVRPLYQMTGEAEFNECFFTDVRIHDDERLGAVGNGWNVAITTLMNERVSIGGQVPQRGGGPIGQAVSVYRKRFSDRNDAQALTYRDRLMDMWVKSEAVRLTNMRAAAARKVGTPGPEGSVAKLTHAELNQEIYELCVDMLGLEGQMFSSRYEKIRPQATGMGSPDLPKAFLRSRANSLEGGTSEVMRNILGERVLGLPGEPRNDKDVPWKDIPRS
jgi:alkylation response protein AidB-like acyl-CoA dehydrogenase